ncbi:MAG: tol-pal system protein YbgF [Magnetospirillum sp. WYHS-4]
MSRFDHHGIFSFEGLRRAAAGTVLLIGIAAPSGGVLAQDREMGALMDRIDRLERDIRTLNVQVARGGNAPATPLSVNEGGSAPPSGAGVARLNDRIGDLEEQIRGLTGKVEEAMHRANQAHTRMDKAVGDIEYRLGTLEKGGAAAQPPAMGAPPQGAGGLAPTGPAQDLGKGVLPLGSPATIKQADPAAKAPQPLAAKGPAGVDASGQGTTLITGKGDAKTAALPEGSTKDQYNHAFDLLRRAQYDQAELALQAFVDAHPNDPLTENARYWLAETFYVRADYVKAAEGFLKAYGAAPKGGKAPDSLLKLGMALSNLDKKDQACTTFGKLTREFPDAPAVVKKKVDGEKTRLGCK